MGWGWLGSLVLRRFGGGREEVVVVALDGIADGLAPRVGVEGVDVLVLGKMDGLNEGLGEIGEGASGARLDVTAGYAGDEAAEGGAEIAGGEVWTGKEIREFAGEFIGGAGLGVFAGVVEAEVRMAGSGECGRRPSAKVKRHKDLRSLLWAAAKRPTGRREDMVVSLELSFGICLRKRAGRDAGVTS